MTLEAFSHVGLWCSACETVAGPLLAVALPALTYEPPVGGLSTVAVLCSDTLQGHEDRRLLTAAMSSLLCT